LTSAFAQHKLVQKPSKQHRFDCLAPELYSFRVAHLNWPVTQIYTFHINFILITQLQCNECSFKIISITEVSEKAVLSTWMR